MRHSLHRLRLALAVLARRAPRLPCSPTRSWPIRARRRGRAICRANCAAWSARTSRSTIPMRRWPATCASWCASGSRPATATPGDRFPGRALRRVRAAEAALQPAQRLLLWRRRRWCCSAAARAMHLQSTARIPALAGRQIVDGRGASDAGQYVAPGSTPPRRASSR